jgi:hydroxymethylpyrimidine pyrophosphatase-like HAD family hydrolase
MKNASEELQAEANYVTETNDDDGVAAAIYRLVFGKQL